MKKTFKYFTEEEFDSLYMSAHTNGFVAYNKCKPNPVQFVCCDLDDKPIGSPSISEEGECGLAWIKIYPATPKMKGLENSFGWWVLKKELGDFEPYAKSINISSYGNDQYIARKKAYCKSFSKTLNENEVRSFISTYLT